MEISPWANLFNDCNSFALLQKMLIFDGIFDGVLMAFLPQLSVVSLFSRQKKCILVSVVPFSLLRLLISFSINMSLNGGLEMFH